MNTLSSMKMLTDDQLHELESSEDYAEYIMANCAGERVICNGHTLTAAMEDLYLFTEFLASRKGIIRD